MDFSFHPAGHVLGSAQIRVRDNKECWVVSGDYKLQNDMVATPYEPVRCDHFITESTFGLPVFQWERQEVVYESINNWWAANALLGRPSMICAYSLGKAQRVLRHLDNSIGPIVTHPSVEAINSITRSQGVFLPDTVSVSYTHLTLPTKRIV